MRITEPRLNTDGGDLARSQELLLRAALLPGPAALDAWNAWNETAASNRMDSGSRWLLPLLYRNLRSAGYTPPGPFAAAYRATWTTNQLLFRELKDILSVFAAAGIDTIVLKGAALVVVGYRSDAVRPMTDVDVLVRDDRAAEAIDLLEQTGWHSTLGGPRRLIGIRHADEFRRRGRHLDLHWSVLQECCRAEQNEDFWTARRSISVDGVATAVLCPADQLLHVCVHGARSGPSQPVSWIADAMTLLHAFGDDLDWERLIHQSRRRRLVVPIRQALRLLKSRLDARIPDAVLVALDAAVVSRRERLEHRIKISPRDLVGTLPVLWFDYSRWAEGRSGVKCLGFPRYLQTTFRTPSLWKLPADVVTLIVKRLRSRGGPRV
jgi:Uncharacterised nucleotidyltransferase